MNLALMQFLLLVGLVNFCYGQDLSNYNCSANENKGTFNIPGANVVLGGLFNMRETGRNGFGCGKIISGN